MINDSVLQKDSTGKVRVSTSTSMRFFNGGTPVALTGELCVRATSPVKYVAGLGYDALGNLCIVDGATPDHYVAGLATSNGALCVTSSGTPVRWIAGLPVDALGRVCMAGLQPGSLFANGEPGVHFEVYNPLTYTGLTAMYQDSVGSIPVTAVEQPVGLWLDTKAQVLGTERVTDGGNESGLWNGQADGTAAASQRGILNWVGDRAHSGSKSAKYTCTDATAGDHLTSLWTANVPANMAVRVRVWVYNPTGNFADLKLIDRSDASWSTPAITTKDSWVLLTGQRAAKGSAWPVAVGNQGSTSNLNFFYYIDDISIVDIAGNHATQSTAASRPTLSARYNLLTKTEQITDAAWSKAVSGSGVAPVVTDNFGVAPDGTTTAARVQFNRGAGTASTDFSYLGASGVATLAGAQYRSALWLKTNDGSTRQLVTAGIAGSFITRTVTPTWQQFSSTEAAPSTSGTMVRVILRGDVGPDTTADILFWHPDGRLANDAALNQPAYQRVNTTTDYDTAGFVHYLRPDGNDDSMQTGNIDFSGVDKVTVWAGITKLSDVNTGIFAELSADLNANNGTFYMVAPASSGNPSLAFASKGTASGAASWNNALATAPVSGVDVGIGDIANDVAILKFNGQVRGSSAADQVTGKYGNYPLYLFRRGNVNLPFNGRCTSLTVRGSPTPTPAADIAAMEQYAARLAGLTFTSDTSVPFPPGSVQFFTFNGNLTPPVGAPISGGSVPFSTVGDGLSWIYPQCGLPAGASLISMNKSSGVNYLLNDWTICAWYYLNTSGGALLYQMGNCELFTTLAHYYDGSVDKNQTFSDLTGAWTLLIWRKSSTGLSTVLRNNVLVASASTTTANSNSYTNVGMLGEQPPGGTTKMTGRISSIGMWSRVLSDQECTDLWNGGQGMKYPGT